MDNTLTSVSILPNPLRLHEFVALEEGYFDDEGLQLDFEWQAFQDLMGPWGQYKDRPQDRLFVDNRDVHEVATACAWGSINNASSGMGKWVPDAYQVSRHAIFVRPDSNIKSAEDLANVEIAVGWLAGSHFNVMLRLEEYLPLEEIKPIPVGGYGRRLEALVKGEVEAASLLDPQIYMADELGMRKIISGTYEGLWWVDDQIDPDVMRKFFAALDKAESAMQADLGKYLHLWEKCIPHEFKERKWNFDSWGHGTRFVLQSYPRQRYEELMEQMERWGLDLHMQTKDFDATTRSCV